MTNHLKVSKATLWVGIGGSDASFSYDILFIEILRDAAVTQKTGHGTGTQPVLDGFGITPFFRPLITAGSDFYSTLVAIDGFNRLR